jgi:thyroglobulin
VGQDLLGRFEDLIQSGTFQLHLDSKTFPADTSLRFLQGGDFSTFPSTSLGCLEGFSRVSATSGASQDPLGCGRSTFVSGLLCGALGGFRKGH